MTITATPPRAGNVGRLGHRRDDHMEADPQAWATSMPRHDGSPHCYVPHQLRHCPAVIRALATWHTFRPQHGVTLGGMPKPGSLWCAIKVTDSL